MIGVGETAGPDGLFDHRVLWALAGVITWSAALAVGLYLRYLDFLHRQALETARREERLELARELHDVVAHHVTGIVVQAQAARFAGQDHARELLSALDSIEAAGTSTLAAIRQLVGLMRDPDDAAPGPSPEPIAQLVQRFAEHGPPVDLRLPAGAPTSGWPPEVASTVYRIVQEALTNVARHAPGARSVVVTVADDPQQLTVEVTDDAPASRRHCPGARLRAGGDAGARRGARRQAPRRPATRSGLGGSGHPACPRARPTVTVRVLLADDQAMVRSGFRLILESQPGITVAAEAADGVQAIALARELRPDVCLVDIRMPGQDGIEVTRALAGPGVADPLHVVIVTTFDTDEYVYGALRAGAVGFLLKDAGPALLIEAVRAASTGDALISPSVTVRLLRQLTRARSPAAGAGSQLSERELDIARSIARGRTNQEIAAELFISLSTVKTHITRIQNKLGVRNRVEIATWSWENRIMDP